MLKEKNLTHFNLQKSIFKFFNMKISTFILFLFVSVVGYAQVDLPVTFEDTMLDYDLTDFGGNNSAVEVDPTDPNNMVGRATKTDVAELWAGTTMGEFGFVNAIPFAMNQTKMTVRVWSPDAGIPIRLKVEDANDPTISVETEANTTMAGLWETLEFDFSNEAPGTAAINIANTYKKASIFFNFGTTGADAGEKTYYWDDVEFGGGGVGSQVDLPVTFEDATIDYGLTDFGGNASAVEVDPTDPNNTVARSTKTDVAELWAGTTMGLNGFASVIPFTMDDTKMTVRVWSPDAGIPIRLKVEDAGDPTISVETETTTTVASAWEMLEFDFSNEVSGTAALNLGNTYSKASIFFNFGTTGADAGEKTYYWDDAEFVGGGGGPSQVDLPITFEDSNVNYALADFGGNGSAIEVDPTDPNNMVGRATKSDMAELWAGTTNGENGLANAIPFTMDDTKMKVRVWSPDADIPVRLKVENAGDPTISVETEANTTVAGAWETLEFDFSNEAAGTAALNVANTYDKVSIFFNFGTTGADAGEKTYYWDDVDFGGRFTVVDVIVNSPDHTVLETAVIAAELDDDLSGAGPFTVFAPTDAALNALPIDLLTALLADPTGDLAEVLLYHVLGAEVYSTDLSDGQMATTLQGEDVTVTIDGADVFINQAKVTVVDIQTDNGVVHVIDAVMLPPSFVGLEILDAAKSNIKISPNPANSFFNVEFPESLTEAAQITLLDVSGKILIQEKAYNKNTQINTSELNAGTYFLRIDTNVASYYQKVMIAK
jgi:uncharacterized surface protein with fasciclin (FAS1) repeats